MSDARQLLAELTRQLTEAEEASRAIPAATPALGHHKVCVGMATFDDFDGVWFTIQALRLYHPEVAADATFIVVDNHPEGEAASALKGLEERVAGLRYIPFRGYRGTAVRDLIFREADADIVVGLDSHVLLRPGALAAVVDWFDQHPDSRDLVQGPLWSDALDHLVGTHFGPTWGSGMYGQWAIDERYSDEHGEPFEIGMQGLGLFACRADAWPGLNPRFRGFGGEEGYLHEKFRQAGGRVLCHPAAGWAHRFARPRGTPYRPTWEDRVRNYRIGWAEVEWAIAPVEEHFRSHLNQPSVDAPGILDLTARQVANPFMYFDAIFVLNLDSASERRMDVEQRMSALDIAWRAERFPALPTPENHHRGCALSWRAMVAEADRRGYEHVLVFEDDVVFLDDTLAIMTDVVTELPDHDWDLCYLGACVHDQEFPPVAGSAVLQECGPVTCTHALAVHHRAFERILADVPPDGPDFDVWLDQHLAIDQYLSRAVGAGTFKALLVSPRIATQPALRTYADADLALGSRYTI